MTIPKTSPKGECFRGKYIKSMNSDKINYSKIIIVQKAESSSKGLLSCTFYGIIHEKYL